MEARNTITFTQSFADGASQTELDRRAEGLKEVQEKFVKKGDDYFYKDVPSVVAFSEKENQISTSLDNKDVAGAMTLLAQSKDWQFYMARGSDTFYKSVVKKTDELTDEKEQLVERENRETTRDSFDKANGSEGESVKANSTEAETIRQRALSALAQSKSVEIEQPRQTETVRDKSVLDNVVEGESIREDRTEAETARKRALAASVGNQYRVAGKDYFFKDQGGNVNNLAFKDKGNSLSTSLNTERVTKSIVELAESKGWTDIKVSGHKDFKRQVWRAASERDISVRGYTPDSDDLDFAESKQQKNTIQPVLKREGTKEVTTNQGKKQLVDKPDNENSGLLVAHGTAPYKHDKNNSENYYVTIENGDKQNTKWGLGLEKAISASGVQIGDKVRVEKTEDRYTVSGERNTWEISNTEKAEVITAVATAVASNKISNATDRQRVVEAVKSRVEANNGNLPDVRMYDNSAAKTPAVDISESRERTKIPELTR